jgi:dCMP deaminase
LDYDTVYIDIASRIAELSADEKIRVGCIIVREGQILSQGWNGQPSNMPNDTRDMDGRTLPTVIHSEANALMKLAKNGGGSNKSTIYCTHSPCMDCSLLLLQAGIERVVYDEVYCIESIKFLTERGLTVERVKQSNRVPDK